MNQKQIFDRLNSKELEVKRIFLFLTKKCNLKCSYCFVKNEEKDIDLDFAKKIIETFVESRGDNKLLYYYGGEPLLKIDLLKSLEGYYKKKLKQESKKGDSIIVTNGTVLNKKIINFLKKSDIRLMISLCGKKERHDRYRPHLSNGESTFDKILENLKIFKKIINEDRMWVSYTFTRSMIPFLFEDLNYLYDLEFKNIHLEPVQFYEKLDKKDLILFQKEYKEFLGFLLKKIDLGEMIFVSKILRILEQNQNKELNEGEKYDFYTHLRFWPKQNIDFFHFKIDGIDKNTFYSGDRLWKAYNNLNNQFVSILTKYKDRKQVKEYLNEGMNRII